MFGPIISQSFQLIWMEFGVLLRLVSVKNLILSLSLPFNIQGREPYLRDLVMKTLILACSCIQTVTNQFLSNLV